MIWNDLRSALRSFRSTPGTMLLAWGVLAVAMAAGVVTFAVVDTVILRRLPFDRSDRLVAILRLKSGTGGSPEVSPQDYLACRALTDTFENVAAISPFPLRLKTDGGTESLPAARVAGDLFGVLRIQPLLGRPIQEGDEVAGHDRVAVLSYTIWQQRYGGAADILGRTLAFTDGPRDVIGVMPKGFEYPVGLARPVDVWIPYVMRASERQFDFGGRGYSLQAIGRLRDGISVEQAASRVAQHMTAMTTQYPSFATSWTIHVSSLIDSLVGRVRGWMLLVLGAVTLVLLTACLNVASLLLARATVRRREFAIRAALGGTRAQLVRGLLLESLTLSLAATATGLLLASWFVGIAKQTLPVWVLRSSSIALDGRIVLVAAAVTILTGLIVGAAPAWRVARVDLAASLQQAGRSFAGSGRRRWREALLVIEIAIVAVSLVGTTLFVSSFVRLTRADIGFERRNIGAVNTNLKPGSGTEAERKARSLAQLNDTVERLRAVPGMQYIGVVDGGLVLTGSASRYSVRVPGRAEAFDGADMAQVRSASSTYFETIGMRLERGRFFDAREDASASASVVILNRTASRRYFGDLDALGSTVTLSGIDRTVVGIVADVRVLGPEDTARPEAYVPLTQDDPGLPHIVFRTAGPVAPMIPAIQAAMQMVFPAAQPPTVWVFEDMFDRIHADRRFTAGVMSIFGLLAVLIGAAGIYAVLAFAVAQQTREIGVRMALGATGRRVLVGVLRETGRHLTAGLALGMIFAWMMSGAVASLLFSVRPTEAFVYVIVAATLVAVGLAAALVPARRAARVDPIVSLRAE